MLAAGAALAVSATVWTFSTDGDLPRTSARTRLDDTPPITGPLGGTAPTGPAPSGGPGADGNAGTGAAEVSPSPAPPWASPSPTGGKVATPHPASALPTTATPKATNTSRNGKTAVASVRGPRVISTGTCGASFYGEPQMTASGERFDPEAMTAAHKTLPLGSRVRVTNLANGDSVTVRINDRGPYVGGRCLDLSRAAFSAIGDTGAGVMRVEYEVLGG